MYNHFFGFKERPFKLVPNPAYLFLSRSHEEALAHLTYAVSEGDGFVEITGEVGTGKTTLCRAFLETLDDTTKTAFIFNPKLDAIGLLKTINDEFGIDSEKNNTKDLVDVLNSFLIDQKHHGAKVVLLIDEAQNLSADVLEQLRLLSNLETTQDKLLQIILVGQPELGDLLDSYELRQLAQRITLSCHLKPFDKKETKAYIDHRISVASGKVGVKFTKGALRLIYAQTGGVPRLINIICDRALLTAFGLDKKIINIAIVKTAVRELSARKSMQKSGFWGWQNSIYVALAFFILVGFVFYFMPERADSVRDQQIKNETIAPAPVESLTPDLPEGLANQRKSSDNDVKKVSPEEIQPVPVIVEEMEPENYFKHLDKTNSRRLVLRSVMALWGEKTADIPELPYLIEDEDFFQLAAKRHGFLVHRVETDMALLSKLNLPAILQLNTAESAGPFYLTLCRLQENRVWLMSDPGDSEIIFNIEELTPYLGNNVFILWKNFYNYRGTIPLGSTKENLMTLKLHLREMGFDELDVLPVYDEKTKEAIQSIQKKHGIEADGLVGSETKIVLYNDMEKFNTPKLRNR